MQSAHGGGRVTTLHVLCIHIKIILRRNSRLSSLRKLLSDHSLEFLLNTVAQYCYSCQLTKLAFFCFWESLSTYSSQQMTYSSKYFREGRMVWPAILSHIICTSWHHISGHSALGILLICEWPHESLKAWRPIGSPVVNVPVSRMQTYYFTCCGLRCTYSIQ